MVLKNSKILKKISIVGGILFLLYLIINIGFNFWLKNNLPNIIKEKLPYEVVYDKINVEIATGTITLDKVLVKNKTSNPDGLGINGNVALLKIENLGIWDAVKNKTINAGKVYFKNPNLVIQLPNPQISTTNKKPSPLLFKNINIENGTIKILKHEGNQMLFVNRLNLDVTNFRLTEKGIKRKLPVVFDDYSIDGENFVFTPNDIYTLTSKIIKSEKNKITIHDFEVKPLMSINEMTEKYPEKNSLFAVKSKELSFEDVELKEHKLSFSSIVLDNPDIMLTELSKTTQSSKTNFDLHVDLDKVEIKNGKFLQVDSLGNTQLKIGNLNVNAFKIAVNDDTNQKKLNYRYGDFKLDIKNVEFYPKTTSKLSVNDISLDNKNVTINGIHVFSKAEKKYYDAKISKISLLDYQYSPNDNVAKLKAQKLQIDGIIGSLDVDAFKPQSNPPKKKSSFLADIHVEEFVLGNSSVKLFNSKTHQTYDINQIKGNVKGLKINQSTQKLTIPFGFDAFNFETKNFSYSPNLYSKLSFASLKINDKNLYLKDFSFVPTASNKAILASMHKQEDIYTVKIPQISILNYQFRYQNKHRQLLVQNLKIDQLFMNIYSYNGNHPPRDNQPRNFFNEKLRNIKLPFAIEQTDITNASLEYEETDDQALAPGKLNFSHLNFSAKNINSGKINPQQSVIQINANTLFFGEAPTQVSWNFDVANPEDVFNFKAAIKNLSAGSVNSFIKPYLHVSAAGNIKNVNLDFHGNKHKIYGKYSMVANDLNVNLLSKNNKEKKGFSSFLLNWIIPKGRNIPSQVAVDVERKEKRSFFNLIWKGIEQGLQRSLIGEKAPEKIEKIKNTINEVKKTSKEVKSEIKKETKNIKKEEKVFLNSVFKKGKK